MHTTTLNLALHCEPHQHGQTLVSQSKQEEEALLTHYRPPPDDPPYKWSSPKKTKDTFRPAASFVSGRPEEIVVQPFTRSSVRVPFLICY